MNPNKCSKPKIFQTTVLPASLYKWTLSVDPPKSGEVSHHMHDSGESPDVSICYTTSSMNSLSLCQSHDSSVSQSSHNSNWKFVHMSVPIIHSIHPTISLIHGENPQCCHSVRENRQLNIWRREKFSVFSP